MTNPLLDLSAIQSQQNVFLLANNVVANLFGVGVCIAIAVIAFMSEVERWGTKKALINGAAWGFFASIFFVLFQVISIAVVFSFVVILAVTLWWPSD